MGECHSSSLYVPGAYSGVFTFPLPPCLLPRLFVPFALSFEFYFLSGSVSTQVLLCRQDYLLESPRLPSVDSIMLWRICPIGILCLVVCTSSRFTFCIHCISPNTLFGLCWPRTQSTSMIWDLQMRSSQCFSMAPLDLGVYCLCFLAMDVFSLGEFMMWGRSPSM